MLLQICIFQHAFVGIIPFTSCERNFSYLLPAMDLQTLHIEVTFSSCFVVLVLPQNLSPILMQDPHFIMFAGAMYWRLNITLWRASEEKFLLQVVKGILSKVVLHMVLQLCTDAWRWYLVCSNGATTAPFTYMRTVRGLNFGDRRTDTEEKSLFIFCIRN